MIIKKNFFGFVSFSRSLATKYMLLINEQCKTSLTIIDLNLIELKYYSFMISVNKCNGSYNSVDDLST